MVETTTSRRWSSVCWRRSRRIQTARLLQSHQLARMADDNDTVAQVAQLYLGNILFALERAALGLEEENKAADAAFYRGIARKLADARGREAKRER